MNTIEELITAIENMAIEYGTNERLPIKVYTFPFNKKYEIIEGIYLDVELDDIYNPFTNEIENVKLVVIKSK